MHSFSWALLVAVAAACTRCSNAAKLNLLDLQTYPNAVCMDGSPGKLAHRPKNYLVDSRLCAGGYYFQGALTQPGSTKWIVHLQGGGTLHFRHAVCPKLKTVCFLQASALRSLSATPDLVAHCHPASISQMNWGWDSIIGPIQPSILAFGTGTMYSCNVSLPVTQAGLLRLWFCKS